MRPKLLTFMFAVALGAAASARAGTPMPPVEVPAARIPSADALQSYGQGLEQERAPLLERYKKWKDRADAFNQKYVGHEFDDDSKEAKEGAVELAWLSREGQEYQRLANAFKAKVGKFIELQRLGAESERILQKAKAELAKPIAAAGIDPGLAGAQGITRCASSPAS